MKNGSMQCKIPVVPFIFLYGLFQLSKLELTLLTLPSLHYYSNGMIMMIAFWLQQREICPTSKHYEFNPTPIEFSLFLASMRAGSGCIYFSQRCVKNSPKLQPLETLVYLAEEDSITQTCLCLFVCFCLFICTFCSCSYNV